MTTTLVRTGSAFAAAGLLIGMLSACTPEPKPTPKPTKTAAFATDEEAYAAAEETYRAYMAAYNNVDFADPSSFDVTRDFVVGDYSAQERKTLSEFHAKGYTRTGTTEILEFKGDRVDGDVVIAVTCNDVSGTDIVDSSGQSVVAPDRRSVYSLKLTFAYASSTLRLADSTPVEDATCTG